VRALIADAGLTIYDPIARDDALFLSVAELEELLRLHLIGAVLRPPIRTRAKTAKAAVCQALGYSAPKSFSKTRPRFPGQDLDVYVQKSSNLQIWNEELEPDRRYALLRLNADDVVTAVRVVTGATLAAFDRTGTLTSKYQARRRAKLIAESTSGTLVSSKDTPEFRLALRPVDHLARGVLSGLHASATPEPGAVLSIEAIWRALRSILGQSVFDPGSDQERNRGAELHKLACSTLGLAHFADAGQFPDIVCQALEVKLQTSPTIDLGLVCPDSTGVATGLGHGLRHCDARYAVFYGRPLGPDRITLSSLVVTTGADFFQEFERFGGLIQNKKLQIPLPSDLFR